MIIWPVIWHIEAGSKYTDYNVNVYIRKACMLPSENNILKVLVFLTTDILNYFQRYKVYFIINTHNDLHVDWKVVSVNIEVLCKFEKDECLIHCLFFVYSQFILMCFSTKTVSLYNYI